MLFYVTNRGGYENFTKRIIAQTLVKQKGRKGRRDFMTKSVMLVVKFRFI